MKDKLTKQVVDFLLEIGLEVRSAKIEEDAVLPGILIRDGGLIVDEEQLEHPGDLLHEAGHLAVVTPERRQRMGSDAGIKIHEEIAALAWSWAALHHLELPADVVFHEQGYHGASPNLIAAFRENCGPGIPYLAWLEMCSDPNAGPDAKTKLPPFPTMTRWLRQSRAGS
ncbi:MAG: hypothetical protein OEQ74_01450 [Gammaproteobacteria bacterium]|nr:hypothetical protein [Gammaproteobacteria bacterium]